MCVKVVRRPPVSILLSGIADISDSLKLANRKSVSHARSAPRQLRDCPHFSQPFSGHFELLVSNSTINLFKAHTPKNIPFSLEKWLCVCCFRAFPCNSTYKYVSTLAYLGIDKTGIDIHSMQISDWLPGCPGRHPFFVCKWPDQWNIQNSLSLSSAI